MRQIGYRDRNPILRAETESLRPGGVHSPDQPIEAENTKNLGRDAEETARIVLRDSLRPHLPPPVAWLHDRYDPGVIRCSYRSRENHRKIGAFRWPKFVSLTRPYIQFQDLPDSASHSARKARMGSTEAVRSAGKKAAGKRGDAKPDYQNR